MAANFRYDLVQTLDVKDQPKLDSDFTKGRFSGQVAIVTGGCGGIGSAIVARFLNDGASVAIVDLNESKANELIASDFNTKVSPGTKVKAYGADLSKRDNCFEVVSKIAKDFGKINHLINAVAYFGAQALDATDADWTATFTVNVQSYSSMGQACYAEMKKISGKENCSIVNFSSISAHQTQPNRWTYNTSKGAVNMLTKVMALDMEAGKVRVNCVAPSWIWTPETAKADPTGNNSREELEKLAGKFHMLRRLGEAAEVAAAAVFLCTEDARYITASEIKVDGGYGAMSAEGHGDQSLFAGAKLKA